MKKTKTKEKQKYKDYCSGCGLCHSAIGTDFKIKNGFFIPQITDRELSFCKKICPASGKYIEKLDPNKPWGDFFKYSCTWSSDATLRHDASSGGTITTLLSFLLSEKIVDRVIQVGVAKNNIIGTQAFLCKNVEDVKKNMGSRYTTSYPLLDILNKTEENYKYAFVGKPCDIIALKNYMEINPLMKDRIVLTISFFCAGVPGKKANEKLLQTLGTNSKECQELFYRGRGWPGFATAITKNGLTQQISYDDSWGKILGRDVNKYCRFCMDGVGSFADISCGDAWYMTPDKKPDFTEHDGRNITFARTKIGEAILDQCIESGYLISTEYNLDELQYIQKYQFSRRSQVYNRLLGLKLCHRVYPYTKLKTLKEFSYQVPFPERAKITIGTIKRVLNGKIS